MKLVLIYWIIGCCVVGPGMGLAITRCPNDPIDSAEALRNAAMWPAIIVGALNLPRGFKFPATVCRVPALTAPERED